MVEHLWIVDIIAREAFLFAGVGLLIGGLDDLLVDLRGFTAFAKEEREVVRMLCRRFLSRICGNIRALNAVGYTMITTSATTLACQTPKKD